VHEHDRRTGVVDKRTPDGTDALSLPARRDADHDDRRCLDGLDKRVRTRLYKQRLAGDIREPLHRQRRVGEQPARVTLPAMRIGPSYR
jgi:hypothetical protein